MNLFKNRFIAHRGLHKSRIIPENSIQAFKNAMGKNYAIEFDINITIDNKFYDIFVYSGIFVATYIFFMGTIKFMLRTITVNERLFIDKITGAFLGLAKAVLINILFLLVLLVISKFDEGVEEELEESKIYELSYRFNDETMLFLPQEINDMINKFDYEREIEKAIKESLGGKK